MSDTLEAPPPVSVSNLPESFNLPPDTLKADIDKYFTGKEGEPVKLEKVPLEQSTVEPAKETTVEPAESVKQQGLADKLTAKNKPAPTPEPKKEEVVTQPATDPIEQLETKMRTANKNWKPSQGWDELKNYNRKLAEEKAALAKKAEELETKVKTAPVAGTLTSDDLKKLQDEHKALSDRLYLVDLENHPQFQSQYITPKQQALASAKELLDAHGVKAGDLASLLSKPRGELSKAIAEMTKEIPDFDRLEVAGALRKAYDFDQQGKAALSQSRQVLDGFKQKTVEQQRAAFNKTWAPAAAMLGENLVRLEAPDTATAQEKMEIEAYNNGMKQIQSTAEKIAFETHSEEAIAQAAIKAAAYDFHIQHAQPRILKEYEAMVKDNAALRDELKALRSRNPNHGIRAATGKSVDGSPKDPSQMSHAEAAEFFMSGGGKTT